jgi:UDP-GlcNAc:undecaprenyl-phosphate/decaprenyl-phosphate GlcNAc-1-phosphate transferase
MLTYILCFIIAFILAITLTPIVKWLGSKFGVLDNPNYRKIHDKPTPLTGGLAVFAAFALALLAVGGLHRETVGLALIGLLFVLFGTLDDAGIKVRARNKILAHLVFSAGLVYFSGIHLTFFSTAWLNWLLTVGFITFMTNSLNMLDGMDGLVSGVAFLSAGIFAILAFNGGQADLIRLSLALMGAALGFLRYNFNPASIFLGEAGSTFIGFLLAVAAIKLNIYGLWDVALSLGIERLQIVSFIVPLIVLGIPIFDTYFVFTNRFLHHIKFSQPGKDHSHHRIHLMGFSQKATVLSLYAIQVILGSIALAMVQANVQQFFALLMIVAIFFFSFIIFLSRVEVYS